MVGFYRPFIKVLWLFTKNFPSSQQLIPLKLTTTKLPCSKKIWNRRTNSILYCTLFDVEVVLNRITILPTNVIKNIKPSKIGISGLFALSLQRWKSSSTREKIAGFLVLTIWYFETNQISLSPLPVNQPSPLRLSFVIWSCELVSTTLSYRPDYNH